jgi:hypothetical protein
LKVPFDLSVNGLPCSDLTDIQHIGTAVVPVPSTSVVDRHRFDAYPCPDPNFSIDANPDSDWHQNDADPHAHPTQVLHILENQI